MFRFNTSYESRLEYVNLLNQSHEVDDWLMAIVYLYFLFFIFDNPPNLSAKARSLRIEVKLRTLLNQIITDLYEFRE